MTATGGNPPIVENKDFVAVRHNWDHWGFRCTQSNRTQFWNELTVLWTGDLALNYEVK